MGAWMMVAVLALFLHGEGLKAEPCGDTKLTDPTGQIKVASLDKGQICTYTLIAGNYTPQVALKFDKLTLDPSVYNLTVYGGSTAGSVIANLTKGSQGLPYTLVVSRYNVTVVEFSRSNANSSAPASGLSVTFDRTKCLMSESSLGGVIRSPVYLPNNGSVNCVYNETNIAPGYVIVVSYLDFNVSNGSVNVTMGAKSTVLTGSTRPGDIFGDAGVTNLVLNVTFKNDVALQNFTALYQTVDSSCSGKFAATKTSALLPLPTSNQLPVKCYMQIAVEDSKVYISGQEMSSLGNGVDSIVFYDGNSSQGTVLGALSEGMNWFVSSGKSMTVVANLGAQAYRNSTLKYNADKFSMYYALQKNQSVLVDFDGAYVQNDVVMLQFDSKDPAKPYVKIELLANSTIMDANVVILCLHGDYVYNFTGDSALFPVVMPSSPAIVMINKLGKTGQKVSLQATSAPQTDCNQILSGKSGQISMAAGGQVSCNVVINPDDDVILDLSGVNLCKTGKLEIYQGTMKSSVKVATLTAGNTYPVIPQMRFPVGSGPRLVWTDSNNTCSRPSVVGRYWTQKIADICGSLGPGVTGTVSTPNYPNQYPLNVKCNWTLPATSNASMMFLSVSTMQFNLQQNMTLQNVSTGNVLSVFNGTTLPNDIIIPNRNLSLIFSSQQAMDGASLTQAAQGAQIMYKELRCGGLVMQNSSNITVPQVKNQSSECIWVIQVPENGTKHSVNVVSANFTVFGYKNPTNGSLEVHDGGSVRDPLLPVNMTSRNATNIKSRRNIMLIRYLYSNSTSGPFGVNITYNMFNCNSSMLCDNGICMHPEWLCDGRPQCADGKDERNCNGTKPIPPSPTPPTPSAQVKKGVAGFWVFVTLVIGIVVGVVLTVAVPKCIRKIRQRNMSRMSNYGSLHEDT